MGKATAPGSKQPPNAQLYARLSYLYQASSTLAIPDPANNPETNTSVVNLSRFYLSHLRSAAKKSVLRLDPSVKRTICKRCDALLVPGVSCEHRIENKSKGGKKRWADVLVVECRACGTVKRFPVGMDERKEKRGQKFKLWSEGSDARKQPDSQGGNSGGKTGGKKGGKKDAQVFKLPPQEEKQVEVRNTALVEDTPANTAGGDVEMKDVPAVAVTNG